MVVNEWTMLRFATASAHMLAVSNSSDRLPASN